MSDESGVEVMLDAFSGQPNPTWTLTMDEVEELGRRLGPAPAAGGAVALAEQEEPVNLGYRGFLVRAAGQPAAIPARFRVFRSVVTIYEEDRRTQVTDERGVEAFLTDLARKRGHESVV